MADHGASSSSHFIHDVFVSFRGDTRYTFTDHLYHALTKTKRINIFRDDPSLRLGDEIGSTLLEAIEKSRMSIIVLCQNYASSSWCLNELVQIMKCSDNGRKRPVIPVFYHVEPTDVRRQKNQYEAAMIKHEKIHGKDSHMVKAWRSALFAVCELSGKHCVGNMYEGEIIDKIVEEVLTKLPPEPLYIKHPIKFGSQFEEVKSLLNLEYHNTRCMVGIYGDNETEKTTFAVELYNRIRHQFEATCFLANVSEKSKESINGLEDLQKTLLCEMGEEAKTKMGSTFKGSSKIKQKLGHKRALLVLDDVDSIQQLESLVGGGDWFGPGSRIIITTKDEDVLDNHLLDRVEIKKYCIDDGEFKGKKGRRYVEEEDVVGLVNDFNIVINQIKEKDSPRNVVSIVGMGGLGKTTLARKIYNSNEVKKLFPCRAWAYVSKDYRVREILVSLVQCLMSSTSQYEKLSEADLMEKLRTCLNGKKYLVVLDDVWKPEVWDKVKNYFPNNNNGGMILVTTRYNRVANYTNSRDPHHQLPFLDAEESWELFCKKVFGGEECPPPLEPIGRLIVKSCQGLPLAIITLAGLVAQRKRSHIEWSQIERLVPYWYIAEDEGSSNVLEILKFSYDDLPEKLKPCFRYIGIYPEDYEIPARQLIQLWIAAGFIQLKRTGRPKVPQLEDVGEEYLKDLVDRNLVQVARRRSDGEGVKTCRIHDLIRELCISESDKADNFLEVYTEPNNDTTSDPCRLSFLHKAESYISSVAYNQSCTLAFFFFFDKKEGLSETVVPCSLFESVNVIYFSNILVYTKTLGDLKRLIHLRYLRIYSIDEYADCIWSLQELETLDIQGGDIVLTGIWRLKRLRHLHIRLGQGVMQLVDEQGGNDKTMRNLQTLCFVRADSQLGFLLTNGSFPNLRKLGLILEGNASYAVVRSLRCLSNLRTLKLEESSVSLDLDAIECPGPPPPLDAIAFPSNLTKITLRGFGFLKSKNLNVLGQITNLQILKLCSVESADTLNFGAAGNFPQLQVFHMKDITSVRRLILNEGVMPLLRRVVIRFCRRLQEVPERLVSLGNLQEMPENVYRKNYWETPSDI